MQQSPELTSQPWMERMVVRRLVLRDLPALEWEGEFTHFRRVYAEAFQRMERGLSVIWVADLDGIGVVGQVLVQLICDRPELADGVERAYVYGFRVRPQYRSQGVGTWMMKVVEEDLAQRGFSTVTLNVAKDNPRARELYERLGYQVAGHEPGVWAYPDEKGVWHEVHEPAWRMEKALSGSKNPMDWA